MNRIEKKFRELGKKKALITFITAGDPGLGTTEKLVPLMAASGADIIELGVPFSDPLADGPVIQASSQRALKAGTTLGRILGMVARVREKTQVPLVLMTYLNPVHSYGCGRFFKKCSETGVDGVIIPDLIPEEADEFIAKAKKHGISTIFLASPTSGDRIKGIARRSSGFLYYVSVVGITGTRKSISNNLASELKRVKKISKVPVACGFGISTPAQAREVSSYADGVIVGSAIVKIMEKYGKSKILKEVPRFISALKLGTDPFFKAKIT